MSGLELLNEIYVWLPMLFAVDLALFQLVADDPLAARWWWRRRRETTSGLGPA
jgi:hypothetical protein